MLSFAECDDNHTAPWDDQRRKYAEGEYSKYAKDGVYVAESEHSEYAEQYVRSWGRVQRVRLRGSIRWEKQWRASRHKGKWQRTSCQATISRIRVAYAVRGNDEPLTTIGDWATTFDDHEDAKGPTVRLIAPIATIHHRNEAP